MTRLSLRLASLVTAIAALSPVTQAASDVGEVETVSMMLDMVHETIRTEYYDPTFKGMAFEEGYAAAKKQLAGARSTSAATAIVAQYVLNLGDSHTRFIPPLRAATVKYGWRLHAVGRAVYIESVQPGKDAEKQGLRPGLKVLDVNGMPANRDTLDLVRYVMLTLRPSERVSTHVQAPDGSVRLVEFAATITPRARQLSTDSAAFHQILLEDDADEEGNRSRFQDLAPGVLLWKLPSFRDPDEVTRGLRKAAHVDQVILDLRGNGGGSVDGLLDKVGAILGQKATIGQLKRRDRTEPLVARSFARVNAKLYVLVDAGSASASEVLARTLQLEQRATILGDRTRGHVNVGNVFHRFAGAAGADVPFAVQVTVGTLILRDGSVLEKKGVEPDVWLVPSAQDLHAGHDRVLATAAKLAGVNLTPAQAGEITRQLLPAVFD